MPSDNERIPESLGYPETNKGEQNLQLGAHILSLAHFESNHQPIVDSVFSKAIKKGEKLSGNNSERRNYAYLSRLEELIKKHGNPMEKRLWRVSVKDDLLVKYDNIPESYWNAKRQELRDNGHGDIELTEGHKHEIYNKERELQQKSLEKWANYLGDEHSPYPLWFKVYAWDGMTKMGRYDKRKGNYGTRNKTTVAPYPNPDAEVLAGVFDVVNRYYGNGEKEFYTEEGERNIKLEQIVQSGSFPKIFNAIQQDVAPIIEPPENPEDVHGEWVEYELGDEDDIARAARGTGWCVASPSVGRHYLEYGTYNNDDNNEDNYDDYNEHDERDGMGDRTRQNHSKFILFHLADEKTGKLSKNACASIRLDPDGNVAEISGLREGQALDDSLVPIVEEKVKSLPGGEKFREAFVDKNMLIALDRKMQNGEDLTKEELEFIYELKRPIKTLDTYNDSDPRIGELKQKYGIEYALNNGVDANQLASKMDSDAIAENLDALLSHGADANYLVSRIYSDDIVKKLDTLLSHDADANRLASRMYPYQIAENLDALFSHGADANQLASQMFSNQIVENLDTLLSHGADANQLASQMVEPGHITESLDTLLGYDADANRLASRMYSGDIAENLETLLSHGADANHLASQMDFSRIIKNLDILINHGANIDVNQLASRMNSGAIAKNLDTLLSHGADANRLASQMYSDDIVKNLDILLSHGADPNQLASQMDSEHIAGNLDALLGHGADTNQLASQMKSYQIARNLDILINHGADIDVNQLASQMGPYQIAENLDALLSHGADVNRLASQMYPYQIAENLDILINHGANIDANQLAS